MEELFDTVNVVSSAYCRTRISVSPILIPSMLFDIHSFVDRHSTDRINKSADKGHPCLIPFSIAILLVNHPLFFMIRDGSVYMILIHLQKKSPKPNISTVFCINSQLRLSKAFSKSSPITEPGKFSNSHFSITSEINLIFVAIFLFLI